MLMLVSEGYVAFLTLLNYDTHQSSSFQTASKWQNKQNMESLFEFVCVIFVIFSYWVVSWTHWTVKFSCNNGILKWCIIVVKSWIIWRRKSRFFSSLACDRELDLSIFLFLLYQVLWGLPPPMFRSVMLFHNLSSCQSSKPSRVFGDKLGHPIHVRPYQVVLCLSVTFIDLIWAVLQ